MFFSSNSGSAVLILLFLLSIDAFYVTSSKTVHGLDDFNIGAVGDWGCKSDAENTVTNIVDKNPELVLGLGDYAYRNNADCWFELVDPIDDRMKIVMGNHDALSYINSTTTRPAPERLEEYMNHFNLSRQFYSFDYQNVHFIAMSSELPYNEGSEQYYFIAKDLKSAQDPGINWILVYLHKPFYTSPNMAHSNTGPNVTSLRNTYHQLFEQYGVDLVLQGHIHNYQRTYPVKYNPSSPSNPTITDSASTDYVDPEGQIFATVGTGGFSFHALDGKSSFVTYQQDDFFGAIDITVTNDGNKLVGKYFSNSGNKLDEFSITKTDREDG